MVCLRDARHCCSQTDLDLEDLIAWQRGSEEAMVVTIPPEPSLRFPTHPFPGQDCALPIQVQTRKYQFRGTRK